MYRGNAKGGSTTKGKSSTATTPNWLIIHSHTKSQQPACLPAYQSNQTPTAQQETQERSNRIKQKQGKGAGTGWANLALVTNFARWRAAVRTVCGRLVGVGGPVHGAVAEHAAVQRLPVRRHPVVRSRHASPARRLGRRRRRRGRGGGPGRGERALIVDDALGEAHPLLPLPPQLPTARPLV